MVGVSEVADSNRGVIMVVRGTTAVVAEFAHEMAAVI
jgi:hypothetical protein